MGERLHRERYIHQGRICQDAFEGEERRGREDERTRILG